MGNRRTIRRFRAIISLVLAIPAFSFSQSEYQIISIPNNIISLALHNGFDALKKNSHFHINSESIDSNDKNFSLLCFPAQINFLNYSNNNLNPNNDLSRIRASPQELIVLNTLTAKTVTHQDARILPFLIDWLAG